MIDTKAIFEDFADYLFDYEWITVRQDFDLSKHEWRGLTVYWIEAKNCVRMNICWDNSRVAITLRDRVFAVRASDSDLVKARLMELL